MSDCKLCALCEDAKHNKIPGRGNSNPRFFFVGQAPGQKEDLRGKCFVGPAGNLLLQAINRFNIKPAWVTNTCKCFPPGDRDPKAKEIKACLPYLYEEIKEQKPEFIIPVGNIALKALTGLTGITKYAGQLREHEIEGKIYKIFPILHPSFILRYPENLKTFERQFTRLANIGSGKEIKNPYDKPQGPWTVEKAKAEIERPSAGPVAFDYETTGIKSQHDLGRVRCVSFSTGRHSFWVRADAPGFRDFMVWFLKSDIEKLCHNLVFEYRVSLHEFGIRPRMMVHDSQAMHFLMYDSITHGLKNAAEDILEAEPWDLGLEGDEWATTEINQIGEYSRLDSYWTWELYRKMRSEISKELYWLYHNLQIPLQIAAAELEETGVCIDTKWAKRKILELKEEQKEKESVIFNDKKLKPIIKEIKKNSKEKIVNLNSVDQIRKIFGSEKGLGIETGVFTEGNKMSVKEEALEKFKEKYKSVAAYLKWKQNQTSINNFLEKFPTFVDERNVIHPRVNACRVVSGRLAITEPPLQAFTDDTRVRGMVISRWKKEGGKILAADYSQFEMRLIANMSNEEVLIKAFENKEDVHAVTAKQVYGENFTKEDRSMAKRINFGIVNEVSAYTLARDFNITEKEASRLVAQLKKSYKNLYKYTSKLHDFVVERGYVDSPMGRRRRFSNMKNLGKWQLEAIKRQAGSFPIQSTGADFTNLALIWVRKNLKKAGLKSKVILQIHDSLIGDIYPGEEERAIQIFKETMEKQVPKMFSWIKVPLPVDINLGNRWEDWKEAKNGTKVS